MSGTTLAARAAFAPQDTNIHFHGMHVSPRGAGDNVFRTFAPGTTNRTVVRVPRGHSPGTYWYHAHLHAITEPQLMGGLSGLIVVEGSHILGHEDAGMTMTVQVRRKGEPVTPPPAGLTVQHARHTRPASDVAALGALRPATASEPGDGTPAGGPGAVPATAWLCRLRASSAA